LSLLKSFYGRSGFRWMLKLPLLYEVWPTFSQDKAPATSQFLPTINASL
jgi:hypothetical protein